MEPGNAPQPGTTVSPQLGDTLNGSEGPVESAHQHEVTEKSYPSGLAAKASQRDVSPVEAAHNQLTDRQVSLHDKLTLIAHRLESVLAHPYKGSDSVAAEDSYGSSDVARKLAQSSALTSSSHEVADHILNNLEV